MDARQRVLDLASGDAALGLTLLAGPVYANTLGNGWYLDDYYRVLDNPGIQSVWPVGRHVIDPTTSASLDRIRQYRPLLLEEAPRRSRLERTMPSDRGRKVVEHEPLRYADDMRVIRVGTVVTREDQKIGCRRHRVGAVGAGLRPAPTSPVRAMSRRQSERTSRFQAEIESSIQRTAAVFRDNDVEASVTTAIRLWWTSRLRGRRFVQLVTHAREVTQERISLGRVEHGQPGRREAMPYFFAVLGDLVDQHRPRSGRGKRP